MWLNICAKSSVCWIFGPEIATPVEGVPTATSRPQKSSGVFISAACTADRSWPQSRLSSGSLLYDSIRTEKPRFGYRRLQVLLGRAGEHVNHKRVHRVYREAGLMIRRKKRKHCVREGKPLLARTSANQEWALDFVHDAVECGRAIRVLSVVDAYTRECLALEVDTSFASRRVTRVLDAIVAKRGLPQAIRCDNGPELTSRHFLAWCVERQIELLHIQPGRPTQNARVESFHGRLRDIWPLYCLNCLTNESGSTTERPESKYWVRARSASISSARLATAATFSWAVPALSRAPLDLVSASLESATALDALSAASCALLSKVLITSCDRSSFLWPYQYPPISQKMAIAKNQMPIESKRCFLCSFVELCANASITTSSKKETSPAASSSLCARLTESREFQPGSIARCAIVTIAFLAAGGPSLELFGGGGISSSAYQIPLSLPVIFCPTAAAVARQGNKLSRTLFRNSRFSSRVVSCEP